MSHPDKYKGIASVLPKIAVDLFYLSQEKINKYKNNLAKGNPAAAKSKSSKASQQRTEWRTWALETFVANPNWEYSEVADHVSSIALKQGHKMANGNSYKSSTIEKYIQGTKKEALQIIADKAKR